MSRRVTWRCALWHGPSIFEVLFALLFASRILKHSPFIITKTSAQGMLTKHNMIYPNTTLEQESYHKAYHFLLLKHLRRNANLHSKTSTNILRLYRKPDMPVIVITNIKTQVKITWKTIWMSQLQYPPHCVDATSRAPVLAIR